MKQLLISITLLTFVACSPFHELAKKTEIGNQDGYVSVVNIEANFKSLTFGDFKFARSNKQYKKLKADSTNLDNILFYAKTVNPAYEYYVLLDPIDTNFNLKYYELKSIKKEDQNYFLLISKDAPFGDAKFLNTNFVID